MTEDKNVYVSSTNQSGGITAGRVNISSQAQPRKITDGLRQQILKDIPKNKPISVISILGDAEAFQLAVSIHKFLGENGYPLAEKGISQAVFTIPIIGMIFEDDGNEYRFVVGARE